MTLHVLGSNNFAGNNGLLSNVAGIRRQQVSRINAFIRGKRATAKQTRALRKAQYKEKLAKSKLPQTVRDTMAANPLQLGAPRCFKILLAGKDVVADAKLHDKSRFVDEGHYIHFAQFGIPSKGVRLDHTWINPDHITVSADHRVYTLKTQDGYGKPFNMHLDFTQLSRPVGHIETADGYLAVNLEPYALSFNVNVSANAGAFYDSSKSTLVWNENSTTWEAASWEQNSMVFSYDTVAIPNPFGSSTLINEVSFQDTKNGQVSQFTAAQFPKDYKSLFQDIVRNGETVPACVTTIDPGFVTPPPTIRATDTIKSVFPQHSIFQFDELAVNFTGAFQITQDGETSPIYAVVGTGVVPGDVAKAPTSTNGSQSLFHTNVTPSPRIFSSENGGPTSLPITGLLNNDPMSPSTTDPTGYIDTVSQTANQDFHDIVCFYMDSDIHTTFISATPTVLSDPTVMAIATDSPDNAAFYKTLQVPYCTLMLGDSTLPEGKQCNAVRSDAQLRKLLANSPIYKRHSDALYRYRYLDSFHNVQSYLDDQAKTDYSAAISAAGASMADDIKAKAAGIVPSNPQGVQAAADALNSALADLQSLQDWATSQKLFYAFELYWYCETYFLPSLIAQSADGSLSASVARTMKKLTLTFGVLENGQQNPNGKSFAEAFNDLIRLFQMSSIIPQFVDPDTASEDLDSLEKEMLQQFYQDNINSSDPNVVAEAQNAQKLAADDATRKNFFESLATSMRFGGSLGSWSTIVQLNQNFLDAAPWYKKLANTAGLTATFLRISCVALLIMPMLNKYGGWGAMNTQQKASWVITAAALGLTFLIKGIQGAIRLNVFWDDLGSFTPRLLALFGFGELIQTLPNAAAKTQNVFAQWFIRSNNELRTMSSVASEGQEITTGMKIFGRSAGEFLTNCVGAVLAGVNIALSAIDLSKTNDPLEKSMDSLMIASSGLQLLAMGANWAGTVDALTTEIAVSVFETAAAVLGALAIVAALAGLVIVIVMAFKHSKPPNPIQDFINKYDAPAGLQMDHDTAIDYFNVIPPDSSATSLNGISFQAQPTGSGSPSVVQLGSQVSTGPVEFSVKAAAAITYLPDTCWNVSTDYQGITTIYTYYMDADNNEQPLCLAEASDGSLQALPPPATTTEDAQGNVVAVDPSVYQKELSMQQWTFITKSSAQTTARTVDSVTKTYVTSAQFVATRNGKFLTAKEQSDGTTSIVLDTVDNSGDPSSDPTRAVVWSLTLQSMGPSDFSYVQQNWQLNTNQTNELNFVMFSGTTSEPLTWSITPALPSFLTFGSTDGIISQASGVRPVVMPATEFTVTASIVILAKTFVKTATVTISVVDVSAGNAAVTAILETINGDGGVVASGFAPASNGQGLKSRGATATQESSFIAAPNGSSTRSSSQAFSVQDVPNLVQLKKDYDAFLLTAPAFFSWEQQQPVPLNQHCTATAAIDKMQNSLSGSWGRMTSPFTQQNVSYESIYFPHPAASPPPGTNDPLDYHGAAQAFVVQSIYNGDRYAQQYINLGATNPPTNTFNSLLLSTNTQRFLDWLASPSATSVTPPRCSLSEYQSCLTSSNWVGFHRALQASGGWANQSYEMYFHFLKLSSLGATEPLIASSFTTITGPTALDPGGFGDITPTTWTAYTGYLLAGPITSSQLGVTGLGKTNVYSMPAGETDTIVTQHADTSFIKEVGYWHSHGGGCCFASGTAVVLGDGSKVAIENVQPGMKVKSITKGGVAVQSVVKGVSRPIRDGRPLYSFREGMEGVRFTATHPVFLRYDESNGLPVLGFVDVAEALMANPLWAAFELEALPREDLIQLTPSNDEAYDVLYDLILDPTPGSMVEVAIFVVSQWDSDENLYVCSEAPDVCAMPAMSRFVLAILGTIGSRPDTSNFFPDGLRSGAVDWLQRIVKHREAAAAATSKSPAPLQLQALSIDSALSVLQAPGHCPQALMDTSEAIASALGWRLQCCLENGWQFLPSYLNSGDQQKKILCLSTHHLALVQLPLLQATGYMEATAKATLASLSKILLRGSDLSASVASFSTADQQPVLRHADLVCRSVGSHMHQLRSTVKIVDLQHSQFSMAWTRRYELSLSIDGGSTVLKAEGIVAPDVPAMWPLYLRRLDATEITGTLAQWNVGWICVAGAIVTEASLDAASTWSHDIEVYAERLGTLVGKDLMNTVLGTTES